VVTVNSLDRLQAWTRNRFVMAGLALACFEPAIGSSIARLLRHGRWFSDWEAVVCAAHALRTGQNPYAAHLACPGLDPEPYVYAPQVARAFEPLAGWLGVDGLRTAGLVVIVPAMLALFRYVVVRSFKHAPPPARLLGFAAVRGSTVSTGNIGFLMQAVVVWARLAFRARWPFVAGVIAGALIKPIFLANLLVLLVEDRPILERMRAFLTSALAGLAIVAGMMLTAGPLFGPWTAALHDVVLTQQPGVGFAKLAAFIGLGQGGMVSIGLYVILSAALTAAVMAIAQWGGLADNERVLLGLGLAQLINPRLNDYDLYLLFPALALAVYALQARFPTTFQRLGWLYLALTVGNILAITFSVKALKDVPATYAGAFALVVTSGVAVAWPHRATLRRQVARTVMAALPSRRLG